MSAQRGRRLQPDRHVRLLRRDGGRAGAAAVAGGDVEGVGEVRARPVAVEPAALVGLQPEGAAGDDGGARRGCAVGLEDGAGKALRVLDRADVDEVLGDGLAGLDGDELRVAERAARSQAGHAHVVGARGHRGRVGAGLVDGEVAPAGGAGSPAARRDQHCRVRRRKGPVLPAHVAGDYAFVLELEIEVRGAPFGHVRRAGRAEGRPIAHRAEDDMDRGEAAEAVCAALVGPRFLPLLRVPPAGQWALHEREGDAVAGAVADDAFDRAGLVHLDAERKALALIDGDAAVVGVRVPVGGGGHVVAARRQSSDRERAARVADRAAGIAVGAVRADGDPGSRDRLLRDRGDDRSRDARRRAELDRHAARGRSSRDGDRRVGAARLVAAARAERPGARVDFEREPARLARGRADRFRSAGGEDFRAARSRAVGGDDAAFDERRRRQFQRQLPRDRGVDELRRLRVARRLRLGDVLDRLEPVDAESPLRVGSGPRLFLGGRFGAPGAGGQRDERERHRFGAALLHRPAGKGDAAPQFERDLRRLFTRRPLELEMGGRERSRSRRGQIRSGTRREVRDSVAPGLACARETPVDHAGVPIDPPAEIEPHVGSLERFALCEDARFDESVGGGRSAFQRRRAARRAALDHRIAQGASRESGASGARGGG